MIGPITSPRDQRHPIGHRSGLALSLASVLLAWVAPTLCSAAPSQPDPPPSLPGAGSPAELAEARERAGKLEQRALEAFEAGNYDTAADLLVKQIEIEPKDFVPRYNLACAHAQLGRIDEAVGALQRAIELGFTDRRQLLTDSHLDPIRNTEFFASLLERWDRVLHARAEAHFEQLRDRFGRSYTYTRDPDLRLLYACGCEPDELEPARQEIARLTQWAIKNIFRDLRDPPMRTTDPWSAVILPSEKDFERWAIREYGPSAVIGEFHRIGGAYNHGKKELVARDLGGSFRHEYLHILHWRSNARAGQVHPIWVQEGLCSLVEDYDPAPGGTIRIAPSWRTNMVKRLDHARRLPPIEYLATLSREDFAQRRPLANYAYARAVFMYLLDRGQLADWYSHFVDNFDADPTGLDSLSEITGMSLDEFQDDFERWIRTLPEVAEANADGTISGLTASIGAEVIPGSGRGPIVRALLDRRARREGIRPRDTIVAIDDRPTRDINEFVRVLGSYSPRQRVTLTIRRHRAQIDLDVTLRPR